MFGYVKPDVPYMYMKDRSLYKAMYCGLCKSIADTSGTFSRFGLSYDITFLSVILHNIAGLDVKITKQHCILHRFNKFYIAESDEISLIMAALNTFMVYYKLTDDIQDGDGGKFKRSFFKKGYKKCRKQYPEIDKIVSQRTNELNKNERNSADSIDIVADSFARMMQEISQVSLKDKANEFTNRLFYNLGKWVYLIDALDDYDKDIKKKSFNVFYNAFKKENKEQLIKCESENLKFIFNSMFFDMAECMEKINFLFNHDLVDNIILKGIPKTTNQILSGNVCKAQKFKL